MANILVVDDELGIRDLLSEILNDEGHTVELAENAAQARAARQRARPDLVLLDIWMPDTDGVTLLKEWRGTGLLTMPVIMMSGHATIETAVEAMRRGAYHYLVKPYQIDEVRALVDKALEKRRLRQEVQELRQRLRQANEIPFLGEAPSIRQLKRTLEHVAPTDSTVLILGETGTGKELVARWLHAKSNRAGAPFVEVNCAAIPSELIESELFGHERGAFTSAIKQRKGKFEQASGGTLFMDEIGDMSLAAQAKVLRALQERKISRVGSDKDVDVDVRIIAATNKNLREEIKKGNFREDLFHRIGVILIKVPPLREHSEDIPLLVDHFIDMICEEYDMPRKPMDKKAVEMLRQMPWTGNIRELRNVIERLVVLSGTKITPNDVELYC